MKKQVAVLAALAIGLCIAPPAHAARVVVGIGDGYYGGYRGYYGYGWGPAYYPGYYAPPPVVYATPVAPPPVVYASPTYAAPAYAAPAYAPPGYAPAPAAAPAPSAQAQATFTDNEGRTCRHFQTVSGGPPTGTACLAADGTWVTVSQ